MEILSDLRGMLTPALGIVLFLGILKWAYGKKSKKGYEEAAALVFADDDDMEPGRVPRSR
ncbi:MAG: CcoQ/FixQ family Cbb3-type cytochrome c oxidase assembly chaperone [Zoogloeaceae bacterium]|jgi:cytochrome c oxidase cbb3-type subunit 4|nr:CcoQ/FixQ family Cbb3-type cytochrome c oxidase assembly chaperone [Zoogloeaceae bacterium]